MKRNYSIPSCDGKTNLHVVCWMPEGEPKAVVQIIHGMVEYIERYDDFAKYLTNQGYVVFGHDHLGHGQSVTSVENWGYIADANPSDALIRDIHRVRSAAQSKYPSLPYYILGHSMGSYLLRRYISLKSEGLKGVIVIGTGQENDAATLAVLTAIKTMAKAKGWHHRSKTIRDMTYSAPYKIYDLHGIDKTNSWICSDAAIMEKYYSDPRCTFNFTLNGYDALVSTVLYVNQKKHINKIPKDLPILLVSGDQDPVGNLGKGVKYVYNKYVESGITDIECKLFEGLRHEILNEPSKAEVYDFINDWLNRH